MLSNISIPILGLADAAILGHLEDVRYLGAVAIGAALLSFVYWGFGFLRMGTTGLVARAEGAGRAGQSQTIVLQSVILALVIAALLYALHPLLLGLGFIFMAPQQSILELARSYADIRIISAPAVLVSYAVVGWCIGRQDTRRPLLIVVATNVINILLDIIFVLVLNLNSDGAALATVIAEYCGCVLALWLVLRVYPLSGTWDWSRARNLTAYKALLRSNRDLFVRTICLLGSFAFFTAAGDKLGPQILAANALMLQLLMLSAHAIDGFAFAAEGLSGEFIGAHQRVAFRVAIRRCTLWCALTALLISLLLLFGQQPLFELLTNQANLRQIMHTHVLWLVVMPLAAAPSYLLDGVFIGAGGSREMMLSMLASVFLCFLPLWYLSQPWGNHGLWLAMVALNVARGLTLYLYYRQIMRQHRWFSASQVRDQGRAGAPPLRVYPPAAGDD